MWYNGLLIVVNAGIKDPAEVALLEKLPKSATGKIFKRVLCDRFSD